MRTIYLLTAILALSPSLSFADGEYSDAPEKALTGGIEEVAPENGSAAQFDRRLPPVIPGEEISDGKKTIKVWSTAGGVSAERPPEPPHAPEIGTEKLPNSASIILDQRQNSNAPNR